MNTAKTAQTATMAYLSKGKPMKYYDVEPDELILRDHLAAERTYLANERTLLAYLRSGFMLFITALSVLKLSKDDTTLRYIAFAK